MNGRASALDEVSQTRHVRVRDGAKGRGMAPDEPRDGDLQAALEEIGQSLHGLRFGSLLIVVQDGVVVQIDRTEKKRLPRRDP